MATRSGKHKDGSVRMGVYTTPFRKAVAVTLAQHYGATMTDVIWKGIENLAIGSGILGADGKPSADFANRIAAAVEIVSQSEVNG